MNGHRRATVPGDLVDAYELALGDSEIPAEWQYSVATTREARDCPLCRRRAHASGHGRHSAPAGTAERGPKNRARVCDACERWLFAGLPFPSHSAARRSD